MEQQIDGEREARLIAASQRGDVTAFNELAALHERGLYTVAYRTVGHTETAADVTQDALLAAFQHLPDFRGGSFRAWLARIVVNKAYDALRSASRRREASLEEQFSGIDGDRSREPAGGMEPEPVVLQRELGRLLHAGLQGLPPEQRVVVVMFDVQGFSYEEIAYVCGTRLGTVKSRLSRGRGRLRIFLRDHREQLPHDVRLSFDDAADVDK